MRLIILLAILFIVFAFCAAIDTAPRWRLWWLRRLAMRAASVTGSARQDVETTVCEIGGFIRVVFALILAVGVGMFAYAAYSTAAITGQYGVVETALVVLATLPLWAGLILDRQHSKYFLVISETAFVALLPDGSLHMCSPCDVAEVTLTARTINVSLRNGDSFEVPIWLSNLNRLFTIGDFASHRSNSGLIVLRPK